MKKADRAELAPCESVAQFVIGRLLDGLMMRVCVDGQDLDGYVHQLDFARGSDYVIAWVYVPKSGEEEEDSLNVKVTIRRSGVVTVLGQDDE